MPQHAPCHAAIGKFIAGFPVFRKIFAALIALAVGLDGNGPATAKGGVLAGTSPAKPGKRPDAQPQKAEQPLAPEVPYLRTVDRVEPAF